MFIFFYLKTIKLNIIYKFYRIPLNTVAAVTLGKDLTKDKLVQACMRMRLLGNEHMVKFYAPNEIDIKIREFANKNNLDDEINSIDILEWSIKNSLDQIETGFLYWSIQGLSYSKKYYANIEFESNFDKKNHFLNCKEDYSNELKIIYGKSRQELHIKDIISNCKSKIKDNLMNNNKNNLKNIKQFDEKSTKICDKLVKLIPNVKKISQLIDEEMEVEIEIEQEEEVQLYRAEKANYCIQQLDKNVKDFIRTGELNEDYSYSFKSLAQSLKKSSLFDKYQNELNSFSSNIYTTNDFINTVITTNYDDNYLPQPKWLAVNKTNSKLVFISSYEANHYLHDFNNDKCELVMLMPVVRQNQKRLFSLNSIKINEYLMQQLLIYSGSFYFNSIEEQEHFLRFICYVPTPRTQQQIEYFEDGKIELDLVVFIKALKR